MESKHKKLIDLPKSESTDKKVVDGFKDRQKKRKQAYLAKPRFEII